MNQSRDVSSREDLIERLEVNINPPPLSRSSHAALEPFLSGKKNTKKNAAQQKIHTYNFTFLFFIYFLFSLGRFVRPMPTGCGGTLTS
jgi:hypothetical protein